MSGQRARKAVIYCHVASSHVGTQELALQSQEARGRAYAARKGYEVVKVFYDFPTQDPGDQTALPDALVYLAGHHPDSHVVIAEKTNWRAPAALREAGAILESPSSDFAYEPRFRFTDGMEGAEPVVRPDRSRRRRM